MAWKRCAGCTRAIPETAAACSYCGHSPADALDAPLNDLDRIPELESLDLLMDQVPVPEVPVPEAPSPIDQTPMPLAGAPSLIGPTPVPTPVPPTVPAVPAAVNQAPSRLRPRDIATIVAGLIAGVLLLGTFLSMRGSASPEAAVPRSTQMPNQSKTTPKPNATAATRTAAARAAGERAPHWSRAAEGRWLPAGPKSLALEVPAANKVHVWTRDVRPVLVVRCLAGVMDVFVFTDSAARMEPQDQDHTVRVAFDEGSERVERWPDSETHDALFARDGAAFAQELAAAHSLRFGFTPHNAEPVVARFDISGLTEQLAPGARQCTPRPATKAAPQRSRAKRAAPTEH